MSIYQQHGICGPLYALNCAPTRQLDVYVAAPTLSQQYPFNTPHTRIAQNSSIWCNIDSYTFQNECTSYSRGFNTICALFSPLDDLQLIKCDFIQTTKVKDKSPSINNTINAQANIAALSFLAPDGSLTSSPTPTTVERPIQPVIFDTGALSLSIIQNDDIFVAPLKPLPGYYIQGINSSNPACWQNRHGQPGFTSMMPWDMTSLLTPKHTMFQAPLFIYSVPKRISRPNRADHSLLLRRIQPFYYTRGRFLHHSLLPKQQPSISLLTPSILMIPPFWWDAQHSHQGDCYSCDWQKKSQSRVTGMALAPRPYQFSLALLPHLNGNPSDPTFLLVIISVQLSHKLEGALIPSAKPARLGRWLIVVPAPVLKTRNILNSWRFVLVTSNQVKLCPWITTNPA